jgi:transcriptional regulator with XRE-family HTH domain
MSQQGTNTGDAPSGLGERIARLRERKGWTQKTLADRAGCSVTYLSEIESGKDRNVSSAKLLRIADELGASLDYLMRGVEMPARDRRPIEIPPDLDEVAQEHGWSYHQTANLLQARQLIRARRTPGGKEVPDVYSAEDWVDLYRRLFE